MPKTLLFYNSDFHRQKPVRFSECFHMSVEELYGIFHAGNYRKNTGTFLMTDCLAKNISADWVHTYDFEKIKNSKAKAIVTNAFHCISPRFVFDREYWQKVLNTGVKVVPMTCGFRYHEKGRFHLSEDMVYILSEIAERNEIGVRGEYAAEVLNRYGIKNIRIIGCHSLFYHMNRDFCINRPAIIPKRINFNFNQCYENFFQTHADFCKMSFPVFLYFWKLYNERKIEIDYTMQTAFMKELISFFDFESIKNFPLECGRYFFSVDDWIKGMQKDHFSIGTQFHGNVAAILAGIPAFMLSIDNRMEELCKVHKIPYISVENFHMEEDIKYYYELADYSEFNKQFKRLYDNFIDYCKRNDVQIKGE